MRILIVEDEESLAKNISDILIKEGYTTEVVHDGEEGLKKGLSEEWNIIILDILLPKLNGFEMLEILDEIPEVIFITAHNQFAIKAFEMNAVDYLLKPYSAERLIEAVPAIS